MGATLLGGLAPYSGLCLLVPLPLVDDILVQRARQHMVASLLAHHQRTEELGLFQPLWSSPWPGCLVGCLILLRKLLPRPFKKLLRTVFFFLGACAVRWRFRALTCWAARSTGCSPKGGWPARRSAARPGRSATLLRSLSATSTGGLSRRPRGSSDCRRKGVSLSTIRAVRDLLRRAPCDAGQPEIDALPASDEDAALETVGSIWRGAGDVRSPGLPRRLRPALRTRPCRRRSSALMIGPSCRQRQEARPAQAWRAIGFRGHTVGVPCYPVACTSGRATASTCASR